MTQAPAAIFKIPTESPQQAHGTVSRARKATAKPKVTGLAAGRVAGIETRAAARGDGEVIELGLGITEYPPRAERAEAALDAERAERRALTDRLTAVPAQARTRNRSAASPEKEGKHREG